MDYYKIMDLTANLGYELSMSGAETFRIEDTMSRVFASYGLQSEVFAIPNYLIVSIITENGKPMTRMRRIGSHGNDLDAVEKLNALSRRICTQHPDPSEASEWLESAKKSFSHYGMAMNLLGNFMGPSGFALLFGCGLKDMILAGLCGILGGLVKHYMDYMKVNLFFMTIASAFVMALTGYALNIFGIAGNIDGVIIAALMILVPGLMFTNAMRDIIYGDTNSGIFRLVQVVLIALAMALGTAVALTTAQFLWQNPVSAPAINHSLLLTSAGSIIGCIGFSILYNIHGPGGILCAFGGVVSWVIFSLVEGYTGSDLQGYLWGSIFAAAYSEIMARVRKYPAISYLVVALFPLIPGTGIYRTMNFAVQGSMDDFGAMGIHTVAIAGIMAVGVLVVLTIVRLCYTWREMHPIK